MVDSLRNLKVYNGVCPWLPLGAPSKLIGNLEVLGVPYILFFLHCLNVQQKAIPLLPPVVLCHQ